MGWISIQSPTSFHRFRSEDIVYVLADGNYSDIYLWNGTSIKFTLQLHVFEEKFNKMIDNSFFRVGRKTIVNKEYVQSVMVTDSRIVFGGGKMTSQLSMRGISKDSLKALKAELEKGVEL